MINHQPVAETMRQLLDLETLAGGGGGVHALSAAGGETRAPF